MGTAGVLGVQNITTTNKELLVSDQKVSMLSYGIVLAINILWGYNYQYSSPDYIFYLWMLCCNKLYSFIFKINPNPSYLSMQHYLER